MKENETVETGIKKFHKRDGICRRGNFTKESHNGKKRNGSNPSFWPDLYNINIINDDESGATCNRSIEKMT